MIYSGQKSVIMCVCHKRTFEELKMIANDKGYKYIEQLIDGGYCGSGCNMCEPYITKMLQTGETAFFSGDFYISAES